MKPTQKKPTTRGNASGKPVAPRKAHLPGSPNTSGEDERRLAFQEYCFDLATKGWPLREIATALASHFDLAVTPSPPTISQFIRGAVTYRKESIADKRDNYLAVAIPRLEAIVRNFLPIATNSVEGAHGSLYVRRVTKHFGQEVEVLDEDSLKEQIAAAEMIVKATEQARKLLGIGINDKGVDEAKLTEGRMQTLIFQAITNNFNNDSNLKNVGSVALDSGDKTIDALESSDPTL